MNAPLYQLYNTKGYLQIYFKIKKGLGLLF